MRQRLTYHWPTVLLLVEAVDKTQRLYRRIALLRDIEETGDERSILAGQIEDSDLRRRRKIVLI